ncbi:(2Fe-2S) ferredoxin [Bryobacterales bacterium F-183]|nr:(2Fe-2S) ferredoxin [Bryobacterales bacterium F-183]
MATYPFWLGDDATGINNTVEVRSGNVPATTDVCVVGGGIAGLTTAYLLAREGREVTLLDRGAPANGETARTSAHLATLLDYRYSELLQWHSPEALRLVAESHAMGIDMIETIVQQEEIACEFARVAGYLVQSGEDTQDAIQAELRDAGGVGLPVASADRVPLLLANNGLALRVDNQAVFHPVRYVRGLATALQRLGVTVVSGANVQQFEPGDTATLRLEGGATVRAQHVVQASGAPFAHLVKMHTKQAAYRTYVAAYRLPDHVTEPFLIWDTADPFHYVRTYRDSSSGANYLIVGGEDHKTGHQTRNGNPFHRIDEWTRDHFDVTGEPEYTWSGQILEPVDGLAYIGRAGDDEQSNLYMVTGTSGNGLTYGTLAGRLITDLIQGRRNPWEEVYAPNRVNLRATTTFLKENLDVAAQYTDWVTPGEVDAIHEVPRGAGAILREGTSKHAVYCDEQGEVHHLSAVCPHLGCVVSWNPAEQTWDCPCHGSRFTPKGQVLNGPSVSDLKP